MEMWKKSGMKIETEKNYEAAWNIPCEQIFQWNQNGKIHLKNQQNHRFRF